MRLGIDDWDRSQMGWLADGLMAGWLHGIDKLRSRRHIGME